MSTLVCPVCLNRWKILWDGVDKDRTESCPAHAPPVGQLFAQTFDDICPERP